jgi:hypothetical protein
LKIIAAIEDPPLILRILTHLGLPIRASPREPARRFDLLQAVCSSAKTGSAIGPTIRLGRHSRKQSNCVDISPLGPMQGPKSSPATARFSPNTCAIDYSQVRRYSPVRNSSISSGARAAALRKGIPREESLGPSGPGWRSRTPLPVRDRPKGTNW